MNKEEKQAIEYFEQLIGIDKKYNYKPIIAKTAYNIKREFEILLNYIDKLQKWKKNSIGKAKIKKYFKHNEELYECHKGEIVRIENYILEKQLWLKEVETGHKIYKDLLGG